MDAILFGKSGHQPRSVLEDPANQIVGDAYVERSAQAAGENVDPIITLATHIERELTTLSSSAKADDPAITGNELSRKGGEYWIIRLRG